VTVGYIPMVMQMYQAAGTKKSPATKAEWL